jgi:pentatricopeptide repeat protein
VPLSTLAFNAALGACEAGGQWQLALELYDQMQKTEGVAPDVVRASLSTPPIQR